MAGLSDASIRALPVPPSGQKIYREGSVPGLCCRVSAGGSKTFVLVIGKEGRKITIGRYGTLTLAQARLEAKRLLAEFTLGKVRPQSIRFDQAVELFLKDKSENRRPATVADYKRRLKRLNFKSQLADITHAEATRKLDKFTAPSERSHILVAAKVFFTWCMKRRYIEHNPFYGLSKPKLVSRDRVLSQDELKRIWQATAPLTTPDRITRLMMVTGQRMGEIEQWQPTFLKGDLLTVPGSVCKNNTEQLLPLGPMALQLLKTFPGRYASWGEYKALLDERTGINEHYMLRDLRRTMRTNLSMLGIAPHVAERLLHHISAVDSVQATYDRHRYVEEQRQAMLAWEKYLLKNVAV